MANQTNATAPPTELFEADSPISGSGVDDYDLAGLPNGAPEPAALPPEILPVFPEPPDPFPRPPPVLPAPPPPFPPPPPAQNTTAECRTRLDCGLQTSPVEDNSVVLSFFAGLVLGAISLTAFSCLWKVVKVYTSRQRLRQVAFKPPDVPVGQCWGLQRYWGWIYPVLCIRTEDIYLAAGLDAVVMLKTIEYGVQLFVPLAVVCLAVLVPVHLKGDNLDRPREAGQPTNTQEAFPFVRLTIANLSQDRKDTSIYWLHFTVAYTFVFYSLWLLKQHYEDMLEFRRKNLLVGEDHHQSALKQAARSSTEETALKQPTPSGTSPPTDSQERQASTHPSIALPPESDGLLNESWVAYQQHPGFIRESQAADSRSAVLHAPLEPSPTGAHDTIRSSNAGRSADLGVLNSESATPSVWNGARRRVMQVMTPARSKWNAAGDGMGLAFTDMNPRNFQGPTALSRPLPTISPSVAGSQSAMAGRQRSGTGSIFDIASMKSNGRRRSMSGQQPGVDASASSPSLSPPQQASHSAQSMGGAQQRQAAAISARSLPTGPPRAGHSGAHLSSSSSVQRVVDRYSDPPSRGALPREVTPPPLSGSSHSQDVSAATYLRTRSGSRRGADNPSVRSSPGSKTPSPSQGDMASGWPYSTVPGRSGPSSTASQTQAAPKRRGHATQPSFSEYVGASAFNAADPSQQQNASVADGQLANMPSFERLSPTDSHVQHQMSTHPLSAGRFGSARSEPDTPTLGAGGSKLPSTIVHEDINSNGPSSTHSSVVGPHAPTAAPRNSRRGGPTAESTHRDQGRDNPRSPDDLAVRSPFEQESSVPLVDHATPPDERERNAVNPIGLATFPPAATAGDAALAGVSLPSTSGRPQQYYVPPEAQDMHEEISTAGGGGSHMSYLHGLNHASVHGGRRGGRPPQLIIDNPNDAASTAASEHFGGVRFEMSAVSGMPTRAPAAVAAVANDRNVIDAEDQWHADRTTAMQGTGSEGGMYAVSASGVASRASVPQREPSRADHSGMDEPHSISPFKWWVDRGATQADANMWLDKPDNTMFHTDFWYDTEAILSRKSSVRFRRTVDLILPVYNEQGEYEGNAKQAVEVHKYCVLVLDVPVDEALKAAQIKETARRQRNNKSANAPPSRAPTQVTTSANGSSSVSQSKLTHSNVSMHVGTHADPENHSMIWNWVGRHLAMPLTIIPGLRQPTASSLPDENSTHHTSVAAGSHAPGTPVSGLGDRTPLHPNRSTQKGRRRSAVPMSESVVRKRDGHGGEYAEFSEDEMATLLESGVMHDADSMSALGLCDSPTGLRRSHAANTDLRQHAAAARLGASLRNTEHAAPPVIEGEKGQEVWRNIMAKATIPKQLQEQLCRWADNEGLLQNRKAGRFPGEGSSGGCARKRTSSAGAVGESRVQNNGVHVNGSAASGPVADQGGRVINLRQNMSRVGARNGHHENGRENGHGEDVTVPVPELKMEVLEDADIEDDGVRQIAVDAAVAAATANAEKECKTNKDCVESEDEEMGGNPVRDEVSKKVAVAFDSIFTDANPRLIPVLNHQRVHLQLLKWDKLQQRLEGVEETELQRDKAAQNGGKPFVPVTHRTGFLGLFGKEEPSRAYYLQRIHECEEDIDFERQFVFKHGYARSYFVVFETQTAAAVAAQALLHSGDARWYKTKMAPGPDDVNWSALWCSSDERLGRRLLAGLVYFMIMCIPLGAFAAVLTVLSDLICDTEDTEVQDELGNFTGETTQENTDCLGSALVERVITQVLPAVLVILWQNAIMPLTIYCLALFEKSHIALSAIDRRILMLFFYWDMFNVFFGVIIAGSISEEIKNLINNPGTIGSTLGTSLPKSSNFFINYLALRAFGLVPFRLILVHGGIWRWLFKCGGKCGCVVTARDAAAFMAPASIRYGRELGVMMLVFITGWAYAVVSPLVVVVSAIYFMSSWIVWRWQVVYVYVRCYEGGGSLWRSIVACIMLCLFNFVFFTSCVFVAKSAFYQAAFVLPLFIVITAFWRYLRLKYHPALKHVALEVSVKGHRVKINDMSYISAPLRPKCSGWHPEWGKAWESWGAPNYVGS